MRAIKESTAAEIGKIGKGCVRRAGGRERKWVLWALRRERVRNSSVGQGGEGSRWPRRRGKKRFKVETGGSESKSESIECKEMVGTSKVKGFETYF